MEDVRAIPGLLLLSCLLLVVTSSPIQDNKDILSQRTGRILRTKTVDGSPRQNPFLSIKGGGGAQTNIGSNVADVAGQQAAQTFRTEESSYSHPPAITNFGERIPKPQNDAKHSACSIKGGCTTATFEVLPTRSSALEGNRFHGDHARGSSIKTHVQDQHFTTSGQNLDSKFNGDHRPRNSVKTHVHEQNFTISEEAVDSKVNGDHVSSSNVKTHVQEQRFTISGHDVDSKLRGDHGQGKNIKTHFPEQHFTPSGQSQGADVLRNDQNIYDVSNDNQNFPDYEGIISPQVTAGANPIKDDQMYIKNEFGSNPSAQADFDYQSPLVTQQDSADYGFGQEKYESDIPASEISNSNDQNNLGFSPNFAAEQKPLSMDSGNKEGQFTGGSILVDQQPISQNFDSNQGQVKGEQGFSDQRNAHHGGDHQNFPSNQGLFKGQQGFSDQQNAHHGGDHHGGDDGQYHHDDHHHHGNPIDWLRDSVPGNPGEDYPILYQVPHTPFDCKQQQYSAGIFGDMDASCQVFHVCKDNGEQYSFLCPNGTVFNQQYFVCDWWYNFKCSDTPSFYNLNANLYWDWDSFTPAQVLNAQLSETGGQSNFHTSGSNFGTGKTSGGHIKGQNNAIKSTIAIDNAVISDKNPQIHGQTPEQHVFTEENSVFTDEGSDQNVQQQIGQDFPQSSFAPSFRQTTRGIQATTSSPFGDTGFQNIPRPLFTSHNTKGQNRRTFTPITSDAGADRPESVAGTRQPDQSLFGQQGFNTFQSHGQNFNSVKKPTTQIAQEPVSFGNDQNQNAQNTYRMDENQVTQFDINQEIASDSGSFNENHQTQTQDFFTSSIKGNTSPTFNPDSSDDGKNAFENPITGVVENTGDFPIDERNGNSGISKINTQVQQEHVPTNEDSGHDAFGCADDCFGPQNEDSQTQNVRPTFDQQNIHDAPENRDTYGNPTTQQQEGISSVFGDNEVSFQDQNTGVIDVQGENGFQNVGGTGIKGGETVRNDRNNVGHDNTQVQDFSNNQPSNAENTLNVQTPIVDFPFNDNAQRPNTDNYEGVQQEYIPEANSNGGTNLFGQKDQNQKPTGISFQQNNQNDFLSRNNFQDQNIRTNHQIGQEHVSVPFDNHRPNFFDSGANSFVPGNPATLGQRNILNNVNQDNFGRNNFQVTQQKQVPNHFDDNRSENPNDFGTGITDGKPLDENRNFQQENVIFPDNRNNQNSFVNNQGNHNGFANRPEQQHVTPFFPQGQANNGRDHSNRSPDNHQDRQITINPENGNPVMFAGNKPTTFETRGNINRLNLGGYQLQNNQDSTFGNNDNHGIPVPFHGTRTNEFRNDGAKQMQDGHINANQAGRFDANQDGRFDANQQNNFRPTSNENQHNFRIPQNFMQEHFPEMFDNNQQVRDDNSYGQDRNYQNQPNFNNGGNQNANQAFQIRLNNFQPENIHMMNRGAFQSGNFNQQRMSFSPFSQNQQNNVHFPGNNQLNSEQNWGPVNANTKGSSNRNFFVTNGHQIRDESSQSESGSQEFSDEKQQKNNRQDDVQEFNQRHITTNSSPDISAQHRAMSSSGISSSEEVQSTGIHEESSLARGNNANSRFKGNPNGRSLNFSNPPVTPVRDSVVSISADDIINYNQPAPDSPTSMSYNGWKPVVRH